MRHECRSPYVKTFWRSAVVGKFLTEHHLLSASANFLSHRSQSVSRSSVNRLESSYFSSKIV
ncbi:MAG: hypothetical protein ACK55Z_30630 [bacterium]